MAQGRHIIFMEPKINSDPPILHRGFVHASLLEEQGNVLGGGTLEVVPLLPGELRNALVWRFVVLGFGPQGASQRLDLPHPNCDRNSGRVMGMDCDY